MKKSYITFSIDDGHPKDLRVAELLDRYGFKATFYVCVHNDENDVMSHEELRALSKRFEVGGHTLNHTPLNRMRDDEAANEISQGKKVLEDILDSSIQSFCYPRGKFNSRTGSLVKAAGFLGARTCMYNLNDFPQDPYYFGVSSQAYSHSPHIQIRHALIEKNFLGLTQYITQFKFQKDWLKHFDTAMQLVEQNGGIAHLLLHSWEIDANQDWSRFEDVLKRAQNFSNFIKVSNGDLFKLCHEQQLKK